MIVPALMFSRTRSRPSRLLPPQHSPSSRTGPITLGARAESGLDWHRVTGAWSFGGGRGANDALTRTHRVP